MRVLFLTGRETGYPRNDVLLRAFRRLGEVVAVDEAGGGSIPARSLRLALAAQPLLLSGRYDLAFVGFYGHLLMLPTGIVGRRPVLFDAFVSTYDTLCGDRATFSPGSPLGRAAFLLDRAACRLAGATMVDTRAHADYFSRTFAVPAERLSAVPVGCNEALFHPRASGGDHGVTDVLYYCTYLPLHGVDTVVRAAALLTRAPVRFTLIGRGDGYAGARALADSLGAANIDFRPPVPLAELPPAITAADVCLGGHFGRSEKAGRTIPGKVYQMLAMARPVIAADTVANRELLTDGEDALLCRPDDPEALAAAVLQLHADPERRRHLAESGRATYERLCSEAVITEQLGRIVAGMVA